MILNSGKEIDYLELIQIKIFKINIYFSRLQNLFKWVRPGEEELA
jgi:hypothetical protein